MLFTYKAKNKEGQIREGTLEVKDRLALARVLRAEGFYVLSASSNKKGGGSFVKKFVNFDMSRLMESMRGVPLEEKMLFSRNLSVMVSSGIPLIRSLDVLVKQSQSPLLKETIKKIQQDVERGSNFSEALARHPKVFSTLYSSMVKSGEATGKLGESLDLLSDQLEKDHELRSRIRGALVYPLVIIVALVGVGILMMIVVVPQLKSVFEELEIELPPTTRAILLGSDLLKAYWWAFLVAFIGWIMGMRFFLGIPFGRRVMAWILLHAPLFKGMVKKINNASFARTLSSLIAGGVPILNALEITSTTVTNVYYHDAVLDAQNQIKKGENLFSILEKYPELYTPLMVEMVNVGEETGKLSELLQRVAEFYEGEVEDTTRNMSSIVEPVLMIVIGTIVGFFAVSVMQPIYGMLGSV